MTLGLRKKSRGKKGKRHIKVALLLGKCVYLIIFYRLVRELVEKGMDLTVQDEMMNNIFHVIVSFSVLYPNEAINSLNLVLDLIPDIETRKELLFAKNKVWYYIWIKIISIVLYFKKF